MRRASWQLSANSIARLTSSRAATQSRERRWQRERHPKMSERSRSLVVSDADASSSASPNSLVASSISERLYAATPRRSTIEASSAASVASRSRSALAASSSPSWISAQARAATQRVARRPSAIPATRSATVSSSLERSRVLVLVRKQLCLFGHGFDTFPVVGGCSGREEGNVGAEPRRQPGERLGRRSRLAALDLTDVLLREPLSRERCLCQPQRDAALAHPSTHSRRGGDAGIDRPRGRRACSGCGGHRRRSMLNRRSERGPVIDRDQLREAQEPLKERYRDEPAAALVTLPGHGDARCGDHVLGGDRPGARRGRACIPATGGDGLSLCSGDMLLEALVACAGVTLRCRRHVARRSTSLPGPCAPRATSTSAARSRVEQGGAGRVQRDPAARSSSTTDATEEQLDDAPAAHGALLRRLPDARHRAGPSTSWATTVN